ncbi:MAG: non-heme iron oxygenase ferredoxin subunit [Gemmatimonadota bacterium]|nr:non-heme iron oxygenase ferredoxin subunit [Gemmatimonadota bacterium]MDE2983852.1 non-heme iron oxygenase ferredoxin subunit [Gemmatimonadota bacterium]
MYRRRSAPTRAEPRWARVAAAGEVPEGGLKAVSTETGAVVLANVDGDIYALEDRCSHQDYPLSAGELEGDELECPFHGARFDVCSGRALQLPAITPVRSFPVDVRNGDIFIRIG